MGGDGEEMRSVHLWVLVSVAFLWSCRQSSGTDPHDDPSAISRIHLWSLARMIETYHDKVGQEVDVTRPLYDQLDVVGLAKNYPGKIANVQGCPLFLDGYDHPVQLLRTTSGLCLRSFGKNSLDENGNGDDITVFVLDEKGKQTKLNASLLLDACERFVRKHHRIPDVHLDFLTLMEFVEPASVAEGDVLVGDGKVFVDAWGQPFRIDVIYENSERRLRVYSSGPNRKDDRGTNDDIVAKVAICSQPRD